MPIDAKYPKLPRYRAALCPEAVNALTLNGFAPLTRHSSGMEMAHNLIEAQGAARKVPTESQRVFTGRSRREEIVRFGQLVAAELGERPDSPHEARMRKILEEQAQDASRYLSGRACSGRPA